MIISLFEIKVLKKKIQNTNTNNVIKYNIQPQVLKLNFSTNNVLIIIFHL